MTQLFALTCKLRKAVARAMLPLAWYTNSTWLLSAGSSVYCDVNVNSHQHNSPWKEGGLDETKKES